MKHLELVSETPPPTRLPVPDSHRTFSLQSDLPLTQELTLNVASVAGTRRGPTRARMHPKNKTAINRFSVTVGL